LVQGVAADVGGLGYFGMAYYEENKDRLKAVGVDNGKGAVKPSVATVENSTYSPLARPIFIYVSKKSLRKPEVREFVNFYLNKGGALAQEVGYVALPQRAYNAGLARLEKGDTGTAFGGKADVNASIDEVLSRSLKK